MSAFVEKSGEGRQVITKIYYARSKLSCPAAFRLKEKT